MAEAAHNLLGVDLDFLLTGPHPWHAKGDATFNARVVVVREDDHMRNLDFVDTVTGRPMTRAEFVDAIHAGQYPDYVVRSIRGVPTPVARPNATASDHLG